MACGATTYQNVATRLIKELKEESKMGLHDFEPKRVDSEKDEKNVRRRVYDALNVLIAAGVLQKNQKKEVEHNRTDPSLALMRLHQKAVKHKVSSLQESIQR